MDVKVLGLHHVTAVSSDPQALVDFYGGLLGLRLVKQTINFDDPGTYHLYFGNEAGQPGTLLTFFPWGPGIPKGRPGNGQVTAISLSAPDGSLGWWSERLKAAGVAVDGPEDRVTEELIRFRDPDGIELEIVVAAANDRREPFSASDVPAEQAILGMYSVALSVEGYERTAGLLTSQLGFVPTGERGNRFRFTVGVGEPGQIVDILCRPEGSHGLMGAGAVHHIAFRTRDDDTQIAFQRKLADSGYDVTPVRDRQYFRSIYFREPGQVLFEVATDPPGFAIDEPLGSLGQSLRLPPWLESKRDRILAVLPPLRIPTTTLGDH